MIPVVPVKEPATFNNRVRKPGVKWLLAKGIPPAPKLPKGVSAEPYWRRCLGDLHSGYGGICGYLGVYLERCVGGVTADHFVAKSTNLGLTYEWDNYRLASSRFSETRS